jgi:hypothetical protein
MKNVLLTGIVLVSLVQVAKAQRCEYTQQKEDKFTGKDHLIMVPIVLCEQLPKEQAYPLKKLSMVLSRDDRGRTFTFSYSAPASLLSSGNYPQFRGSENDKLIFLHGDNTRTEIQMRPIRPQVSKTEVTAQFDIPDEIFEILLVKSITDVRAQTSSGSYDFPVASNIITTKAFKCIQ